MVSHQPGGSLAHRTDPRAKLAVQVGFAAAAFAHTTPRGLATLTAVAAAVGLAARTSPAALWAYRWLLPVMLAGPAVATLRLGPPWVEPAAARGPLLATYRVLLVLFVGAAYVRTTPVRDTRAALQRTVPGRPGQFLGLGVAFVLRLLPLLRRDIATARQAVRARLGGRLPVRERMTLVATAGLNRAFARADRLALALRARCFAWNPTLPALSWRASDWVALGAAAALAAWALV